MEKRKRTPENCIKVPGIDPDKCLDCGEPRDEWHHLVPFSKGGKMMLPLCNNCNDLIHDKDLTSMRALSKDGKSRARERGESNGVPSKWSSELIARIEEMTKDGLLPGTIGKTLTVEGIWPMSADQEGLHYKPSKRHPHGYTSSPEVAWAKAMATRVRHLLRTGQYQRECATRKATYEFKQEVADTGGTVPIGAWIPDDSPIVRGQNLPNLFNEGS